MTERPHIVLLPGLHGTDDLWPPFLAAIPAAFPRTVICYPPDRPLAETELIEFIEQHLPPAGPLLLVGESFSGPLAIEVGARNSQRVCGLVLSATYVLPPWPKWICLALAWVTRVSMRPVMAVRRWLPDRIADVMGGRVAHDALRHVHPRVLASRLRVVAKTDCREALCRCAMPILYLQGAEDIVVRPRSLRTLLDLCPRVTVRTFRSSHMVFQRRPKEAWAAITNWLDRSPERSGD